MSAVLQQSESLKGASLLWSVFGDSVWEDTVSGICQILSCQQGHILIIHPPREAVRLPLRQGRIAVCFIISVVPVIQFNC